MLTLISFAQGYDQPSFSPFCVKAEYLLRLAGVSWRVEHHNDPRKMPRGKLPVLRTKTGLVHDSGRIQTYLEDQGAPFDSTLSEQDLILSHSLRRMVEEHLYFLLVLDRWENEDVWPLVRDAYFEEIPKLLRGLITGALRKKLLAGLATQGLGRLTWEERLERAAHDMRCLRGQLGDKAFLFGDNLSTLDASVVAMLGAIRSTPRNTRLSLLVSEDEVLSAYVDRGEAAFAQL